MAQPLCVSAISLSLKVIKDFLSKKTTVKDTSQLTDWTPCFGFSQLSAQEEGASSSMHGIYFSVFVVILHYQTIPLEIRTTSLTRS